MKRFAANYVVSETGFFLKNGIVEAEENGKFIRCIDTRGDLRETALLSFHNGILMTGSEFIKIAGFFPDDENPVHSFILSLVSASARVTMQNLIETGKRVQEKFPEMDIQEILQAIPEVLQQNVKFRKEQIFGIFLLTGADLARLRFTSKSRLKKIL